MSQRFRNIFQAVDFQFFWDDFNQCRAWDLEHITNQTSTVYVKNYIILTWNMDLVFKVKRRKVGILDLDGSYFSLDNLDVGLRVL